ncbi:hypothetical protein [Sphingomonas soli]|uniref:hypothetical protein n=1 Tax=Sphingomonas soli TaxID=266127 RepID=UPI0012EE9F71|nr:hypothetical protein [Sphingomonas soli]
MQKRVSPDELLICHVVAGRYLHQAKLAEFVALPFSDIVTTAWLDRCELPAQLVTPRLTVGEIRKAATTTAAGWTRVLRVLEAARSAVSSAASATVRDFLQVLRSQIGPEALQTGRD